MKHFSQMISHTPLLLENEPQLIDWEARPEASQKFTDLICNTSSCSPYLRGIIEKNISWVQSLEDSDPEEICRELCQPFESETSSQAAEELRERKRKISLIIALADLGGVWKLNQVTETLTTFADFACNTLLKSLVDEAISKGKIKSNTKGKYSKFAGIFILAMGKMGGKELNYSSDIDLVVLFDEKQHPLDQFNNIKAEFVKITRRFSRMMSETTAKGYIFRTDLRLRPDPFVNPVCISVGGAERYYESFARAWERAAYIKARPCAGDLIAGAEFIKRIGPFIWRLQFDFTAFQDTSEIQDRIWENIGTSDLKTLFGYNLKLGKGGIREIELFVQTYQMVAGGRDSSLRVRSSMGALDALVNKGWVKKDSAEFISNHYTKLRTWEHRVQMIRDTQTHLLPKTQEEFQRLSCLTGWIKPEEFKNEIRNTLQHVQHLVGKQTENKETEESHSDYSFMNQSDQDLVEQWRHYPAFRTKRANQIFSRLQSQLFNRIARSSNPREALIQFDSFLKGLPAGVQLFSLFEANPELMNLLTDTCATAPKLAQFLSRNARVLDAVLESDFFERLHPTEKLQVELSKVLSDSSNYEWSLRQARRWMHEKHFKVGIQHLKNLLKHDEIPTMYTSLADAVIHSITPIVVGQFSRLYGEPPGRGFTIVSMGSLGSKNLTSKSDLDLIMIYDPLSQESSKGKKSISSRQYFARLTQALVSSLTSRLPEGQLYEIDMRLRPSGKKGPVATSFESFKYYQLNDAWTWEHLAMTRARPLSGNQSLAQEIEEFRRKLISQSFKKQKVVDAVIDMRERLAKNTPVDCEKNVWELRNGEGRILDIELVSQAGALLSGCFDRGVIEQCDESQKVGWMTSMEGDCLKESYRLLGKMKQTLRLSVEGSFRSETAGSGVIEFLLSQTGFDSLDSLIKQLDRNKVESKKAIRAILNRR